MSRTMLCNAALMVRISNFYSSFKLFENQTVRLSRVHCIMLWDHRRICGPSLTETSLCGTYLYYAHPSNHRAMKYWNTWYTDLPLCFRQIWSHSSPVNSNLFSFIFEFFFFLGGGVMFEGDDKWNLPSLDNPVVLLVQGVVQARPLRAARC
jgi:hypothetical protein